MQNVGAKPAFETGLRKRPALATGAVADGKVVGDGEPLTESSTVTVLLRDDDEAFDLTPDEEEEPLASIVEIDRGEFNSGAQLLKRLRPAPPPASSYLKRNLIPAAFQ